MADLRPNNGANKKICGNGITANDIVLKGKVRPPASARLLLNTLHKKSPKNVSDN